MNEPPDEPPDLAVASKPAEAAEPVPTPDPFEAGGGTRPSPADTAPAGPRRRTLVILGVVATILSLVAVIGLAAGRQGPTSPADVSATGLGAPADTTYPTAPTADVQRIHTALHDMGARCTPAADPAAQAQIGHDVDELITFAARYPDARFTVDGEDGQALNLLLIARDEMGTCAPAAAARANHALPPQYRATPSPTAPTAAATGASTGK